MKKMEREIALSREQMKELANLGVDISDASMCWIQEPNEKNFRLVVHDEYCYEMGALNQVPAYTLQDLVVKFKAEVDCFDPETIEEYPSVKDTPWMFRVYSSKQPTVTESFTELGATPLLAGYAAYLTFLKPKKE